jgi:hypothetical protein
LAELKLLLFVSFRFTPVPHGVFYYIAFTVRAITPADKTYNMKSRITIEVDFDNGNVPVIIIQEKFSDDIRDKLLFSFLEKGKGEGGLVLHDLGHFTTYGEETDVHRWSIAPAIRKS